MKILQWRRLCAFAILSCSAGAASALPVIPDAVGFGIDTPAGRGGKIIRVTNLNASGSGSLQACVNASGPRICVFEVSGVIQLKSDLKVTEPYLTIAGQTAPDPGIVLIGAALKIQTSNVLVQHIAVRAGDRKEGPDFKYRGSLSIASTGERIENIVIDHCSFSWGTDETVEIYDNWDNVTISNSIISEGLHNSLHPSGPHGLAILFDDRRGGSKASMFGNLIAHSVGRNPRTNASKFVFVNNVVYNGKDREMELFNKRGLNSSTTVVGNVFIKGPNSLDYIKAIRLVGDTPWNDAIVSGSKLFVADNQSPHATDDPWSVVDNKTGFARALLEALSVLAWPGDFDAMPSSEVLDHVLTNVGMRPGPRNDIDARIVSDVKNRTGRIINCVAPDGTERCSRNAGGWPKVAENYRELTLPEDPNGDDDNDGYTNAEEWLHALAAQVEGRSYDDTPKNPGTPIPAAARPNPPRIVN